MKAKCVHSGSAMSTTHPAKVAAGNPGTNSTGWLLSRDMITVHLHTSWRKTWVFSVAIQMQQHKPMTIHILFTISQYQRNCPEQLQTSITMKKIPHNHLSSWHNVSWVIKTGTRFCSHGHPFKLFLRKLAWKTEHSNLQVSPDEESHLRQPGECSNSQPNNKMKDIFSTQPHTGGDKTGRLHLDQVLKTVWSHNSSTGRTQPLLQSYGCQKAADNTPTVHSWNLQSWSLEQLYRGWWACSSRQGKAGLI